MIILTSVTHTHTSDEADCHGLELRGSQGLNLTTKPPRAGRTRRGWMSINTGMMTVVVEREFRVNSLISSLTGFWRGGGVIMVMTCCWVGDQSCEQRAANYVFDPGQQDSFLRI